MLSFNFSLISDKPSFRVIVFVVIYILNFGMDMSIFCVALQIIICPEVDLNTKSCVVSPKIASLPMAPSDEGAVER